jgi:hypothetical protein
MIDMEDFLINEKYIPAVFETGKKENHERIGNLAVTIFVPNLLASVTSNLT